MNISSITKLIRAVTDQKLTSSNHETNFTREKDSRYLLAQGRKRKHQNNVSNLFKLNNRDDRTTSTDCRHCFSVSIVDFEQVNIAREGYAYNLS